MLALMLGRDAERYLDTQRGAHLQRMRELTDIKRKGSLVDALLADHGLFHLEADLRWIDLTAARLDALAKEVGFLTAGLFLRSQLSETLQRPGIQYYVIVVGGLVAALASTATTLPLLGRITGPETARNE